MSDKNVCLSDESTDTNPGLVVGDYISSEDYNLSSQIPHLRQEQDKLTNLEARRAVEDVLEMRRYRELHQDYYDY